MAYRKKEGKTEIQICILFIIIYGLSFGEEIADTSFKNKLVYFE